MPSLESDLADWARREAAAQPAGSDSQGEADGRKGRGEQRAILGVALVLVCLVLFGSMNVLNVSPFSVWSDSAPGSAPVSVPPSVSAALGEAVTSSIPPAVVPATGELYDRHTSPYYGGVDHSSYRMPAGVTQTEVIDWYNEHMTPGSGFGSLTWLEALPPGGVLDLGGPDWFWCIGPDKSLDVYVTTEDQGRYSGRVNVGISAPQPVFDGACG